MKLYIKYFTAQQVHDVAIVGGHAVTVPYDVLKAVASHPITDNSLAQFKVDWEQVYGQGKVIYDLELEVRG